LIILFPYTNSFICYITQEQWDIPDTHDIPKLKDKWLSYACERWRAFKTNLTRRYLNNGKLSDKSPLGTYKFIDEETWQEFIKTREDPYFLVCWTLRLISLSIKFIYSISVNCCVLFITGEKK